MGRINPPQGRTPKENPNCLSDAPGTVCLTSAPTPTRSLLACVPGRLPPRPNSVASNANLSSGRVTATGAKPDGKATTFPAASSREPPLGRPSYRTPCRTPYRTPCKPTAEPTLEAIQANESKSGKEPVFVGAVAPDGFLVS